MSDRFYEAAIAFQVFGIVPFSPRNYEREWRDELDSAWFHATASDASISWNEAINKAVQYSQPFDYWFPEKRLPTDFTPRYQNV